MGFLMRGLNASQSGQFLPENPKFLLKIWWTWRVVHRLIVTTMSG
jgi:hypothetical protein